MSNMPDFFSIYGRPVKYVKHKDGTSEFMTLDMRTGEWERDYHAFSAYMKGSGDVEDLTEPEFKELVSSIRKELGVPEID